MKSDLLQTAKGTRDFGSQEKLARNKIQNILVEVFESFGYNPIETPIIERYELFASKFGIGQESDAMKETFKLKDQGQRDLVLRTEFTVPFARFIATNPQIKKPFKRYQIGEVFRDGPIKLGRYREFYQCDVDVYGSADVVIDAELIQLAKEAFVKLDLPVEIRINNRKLLNEILEFAQVKKENQTSVIIIIDKYDKIGLRGVEKELLQKGLQKQQIKLILQILNLKADSNEELIKKIKSKIGSSEGLQELEKTFNLLVDKRNVIFSPFLARGLAYYTGNIFEIYLQDTKMLNSALCAGGRYDDMIGGFLASKEKFPALGISFGLDTIYDALLKLNKKVERKTVVELYLAPMKDEYFRQSLKSTKEIRKSEINVDIGCLGFKKALEFANYYDIKWVAIIGEDEIKKNKFMLKNMISGKQELVDLKQLINIVKEKKL